ncbi:hypothetical protein [Chitinophaga sp. RAB17]|uniref:hypothetical protein n=1 Tax=Chitinophaga sp. RAB17 TaxID=3233049 RepID=UPI003F924ED2
MMHKFVHGYLLSHPPDPTAVDKNGRDHNQMTKDWVNIMAGALMELFPDLSTTDAAALSWGGLENTDAYKAMSQGAKDSIENINLYNQMGLNGTKCNH